MKSEKEIFWATLKSFGFTKKTGYEKILLAHPAREKNIRRKFEWNSTMQECSFGGAGVEFLAIGWVCIGLIEGIEHFYAVYVMYTSLFKNNPKVEELYFFCV